MKQAENRINVIEDMAGRNGGRNDADVRLAEVFALCEIARQLSRLGDLYVTDLVLRGALDESLPGRAAARAASHTFLRREYDDARSKSSPGT